MDELQPRVRTATHRKNSLRLSSIKSSFRRKKHTTSSSSFETPYHSGSSTHSLSSNTSSTNAKSTTGSDVAGEFYDVSQCQTDFNLDSVPSPTTSSNVHDFARSNSASEKSTSAVSNGLTSIYTSGSLSQTYSFSSISELSSLESSSTLQKMTSSSDVRKHFFRRSKDSPQQLPRTQSLKPFTTSKSTHLDPLLDDDVNGLQLETLKTEKSHMLQNKTPKHHHKLKIPLLHSVSSRNVSPGPLDVTEVKEVKKITEEDKQAKSVPRPPFTQPLRMYHPQAAFIFPSNFLDIQRFQSHLFETMNNSTGTLPLTDLRYSIDDGYWISYVFGTDPNLPATCK